MTERKLNIKIFPAINGDCILLEILGKIILIDGGYVNTYKNFIKPELLELSAAGFSLSHLIVSHIDADHISGVIEFLEENLKEKIIAIDNVWHNSYRHIQNFGTNNIYYELQNGKRIEELKVSSYIKEEKIIDQEINAKHGSTLSALILRGGYNWNKEFDEKAVSVDNLNVLELSDAVKIVLLSPNNSKLERLRNYWRKELFKMGFVHILNDKTYFDDAFEFLIAHEKEKRIFKEHDVSAQELDIQYLSGLDFPEDEATSNGSSISFLVEVGKRKLLFLADSHPSLIIESLKKHYTEETFPIQFDIIKVSHHGSIGNTSKELMDIIDSENYIFSTNGKSFNHPDIETIARIIIRESSFKRKLYFNYPNNVLEKLNTLNLLRKYNFECIVGNGNSPIEIKFNETNS